MEYDVDIDAGPHTRARTAREQGGLILQMHFAMTVRRGSVRFPNLSEGMRWKEDEGNK